MPGRIGPEQPPLRLLFVCVENANRSQMAEAFARMQGSNVDACSAGSRPAGVVSPDAIRAMSALGYDMSTHHPKSLDALPGIEFDAVITMGCGDACPHVAAKRREDWPLPDPRGLPAADYDEVRDEVGRRVSDLVNRLRRERT